jgi:hypothetical protein
MAAPVPVRGHRQIELSKSLVLSAGHVSFTLPLTSGPSEPEPLIKQSFRTRD